MKTKFWTLVLSQIMMLCCCVSFASCSDDDEDEASPVVGTWVCTDIEGYSVQFYSNNTGLEKLVSSGTSITGDFDYRYNEEYNEITIVGSDENILLENGTYNIVIGNSKMEFGGLQFKRR